MRRMLMIATTAAMIEQFNKNNILILEKLGYEVHVIGNFEDGNPISEERISQFKEWLKAHHAMWFHVSMIRQPLTIKNLKAYKQVVMLIRKYKYDFIHCHTPVGAVIARCAAHKTNTKVIYTAHGFHFFQGAPIKNWLFFYPVEWLCSWWTDVLITINSEDCKCALKHFHMKKLKQIPGIGIDVNKFSECHVDREEKCRELGISKDKYIILSVGELQPRKNHMVIIEALHLIKDVNIIYLIVGQGELRDVYEKKIKEYNLEENVKLLGFRNDIDEICKTADCFIFPSLQEGLPVALMEAMASGLPVICSKIRGNIDLIDNGKGGYYVDDPRDSHGFANVICKLYQNDITRKKFGKYNMSSIKKYCVENIQSIMEQIYKEL